MSATDGNEMDGYGALVSELRANPPVAPERLRARVLEGAPAARAPRSRKRKLALVVVPLAVVLAVGAAVVHGFVNSSSHPDALSARQLVLGPTARVPGSTEKTIAATQGKLAQSDAPSATSQHYSAEGGLHAAVGSADLAAPLAPNRNAVTIPTNRLVHATASLQVGVKRSELSAKTNEASQIAGSFGGYAKSVRYESTHQGAGEAVLALRVPVQHAQAAIAKLGGLGTLLSQQVSTQDLQAKLTHQTSGIGSLRRAITVYETALQSTTLPASQRVTIQIRLNNARRALSQLRHARAGTLASGANADISLLLTTNNHAVVPAHHGGSTRIGRLLGSAAHFLALEGIIVLYALIVLAPVLLLGGLGWWILRERRRREERLLASA